MNNLTLKQKIMIILGVVGAILIAIFQQGLYSKPTASSDPQPQAQAEKQIQTDTPEIVSTNPTALEGSTLWALQPIEITFNLPLQNAPEFKHKIEPKPDYKVELSDDKKTVKIIPTKPLPLGQGFTLFIQPDTKFDGDKKLGKDYIFHFQTITYKGV